MALAGGYVLAEELSLTDDVDDALANYENRLRPHIELRQEKARDLVKSFVPGSKTMQTAESVAFKLLMKDAFAGTIAKYLYMSGSLIRDRMLHRLPASSGNTLGYRIAGKLDAEDITMVQLDVERALANHDEINMLMAFDDFEGMTRKGLAADFHFASEYRHRINKLAVVGGGFAADLLKFGAAPLNSWNFAEFETADEAWAWLVD